MRLLITAILIVITCPVSYGHDGGYSPGFEPFESVKLFSIKPCAKEASSETVDAFKCISGSDNYSAALIREGESPQFIIKNEHSTVISKYIKNDVYPYLTEAYIADLNRDGKADLVMIIPSGGSGLGSEGCFVIFALSTDKGFALSTIGSMGFRPENVIDFFNDRNAQIVQTEFINGTKGKDGKLHNYWVHSFLEVNGTELRPSMQIPQRWIMYSGKKNHRPTKQLTMHQKAALWQAQYHSYFVNVFDEKDDHMQVKMTTYEIWNIIIQGIIGFGTLLLAALAIWGGLFRSWFTGPKLKVTLHNPHGELTNLTNGTAVRYYHLRVVNSRQWAPAEKVRVLLTKVLQRAANGTWTDRSFSGPLQLTWQFPQIHVQLPLIGPDDIADLGCITQGQHFQLTPYIVPNNFSGLVHSNQQIRIELIAVADNGKSDPLLIEISWDGNWSSDDAQMSQHLIVREV